MKTGILEIIMLGISGLLRHPGRSILTMIGILFGVSAVIATMSVVEGISLKMQKEVIQMGVSNVILSAVKPSRDPSSNDEGALTYGLAYKDLARIKAGVFKESIVVPTRIIKETARRGTKALRVSVFGTIPEYREAFNLQISKGRWLCPMDIKSANNLCILDESVSNELFPRQESVGKVIRLGDRTYRVVGVLKSFGKEVSGKKVINTGESGRIIYIPLSSARKRFGKMIIDQTAGSESYEICELNEITVHLKDIDKVRASARIITALMEKYHEAKVLDWEVRIPLDRLETLNRMKWLFLILGVSIAAISMLVGGIGIMNIMLSNVIERTREIGIRRALGARQRDIIRQFLVETVILSFTGGLLGIPAGIGMASAIPMILSQAAISMGIGNESALTQLSDTIVTPMALALALGSSIITGIASGVYPAVRAAKMDPIQALRHE